jgi:hypothetical protein
LTTDSSATDASGNKRLGDIGIFLRDKIIQFFESRNIPITLKYIDPSYAIRSVPASPQDNVYCSIDVAVQGLAVKLRQNVDLAKTAVEAIADRDVH